MLKDSAHFAFSLDIALRCRSPLILEQLHDPRSPAHMIRLLVRQVYAFVYERFTNFDVDAGQPSHLIDLHEQ